MEITQDMRWVLHTPISDANALTSLERLTAEQIRYCLDQLKDKPQTTSKIKRLEARLRKLERGRAAAGSS